MTKPESKTALKWMDAASALTKNEAVLQWMEEMAAMTQPDKIVWITGEEEQLEALRKQAVEEGILIKLNEDKLPGCYLHRTDLGRCRPRRGPHLHLLASARRTPVPPTTGWTPRRCTRSCTLYAAAPTRAARCTSSRTPWAIIGSPFAKYGIELTDSIYVVLNMAIMTRVGNERAATRWAIATTLSRACTAKCDTRRREPLHRPLPARTTPSWSINSGYGGNVLLGKKCFALRIASYLGRKEGWMAEHMLILGIENPRRRDQVHLRRLPLRLRQDQPRHAHPARGATEARATRSGCVGDDIAWLRIGEDGRLWAVNPENGFFGVAPGTNDEVQPQRPASPRMKDTIFTNVAHNLDDNTVWWEGLDKNPPEHARSTGRGRALGRRKTATEKARASQQPLHRARHATAPASAPSLTIPRACPSPPSSSAAAAPRPRRWSTSPSTGSTVCSSAPSWRRRPPPPRPVQVGVVRRDPMAMLPFCGYHMGDYWQHWLDMGKKIPQPAQDLQRQLVPYRRRGSLHLARLRRQYARAAVDHLPRGR